MLNIGGRKIDYVEYGSGSTVLLIPGSFGTPSAWRGIQKRLPATYRIIATSICGYGETEDTRTLDDLGMDHQTEIIECIVGNVSGPVHLVGHSFGATVALASALSGTLDIRSIATFEANPLALIEEYGSVAQLEKVRDVSKDFESAYYKGEADAPGRIIDFWGGVGSFAAMPEVVKDYCRATAYANVLDWRTAFSFHAAMADYAKLDMPVLLLRGSLANEEMVTITDALAQSLPNVQSAVVDGANHFLITSHADECARLLTGFLAEASR